MAEQINSVPALFRKPIKITPQSQSHQPAEPLEVGLKGSFIAKDIFKKPLRLVGGGTERAPPLWVAVVNQQGQLGQRFPPEERGSQPHAGIPSPEHRCQDEEPP